MPGIPPKCLNTPDERCACQARRLRSEGWGRTYPLFFWLGGALLDLIGGLLEQFGAVEPKFSKKKTKKSPKWGGPEKWTPPNMASEPDKCNARRGYLESPLEVGHWASRSGFCYRARILRESNRFQSATVCMFTTILIMPISAYYYVGITIFGNRRLFHDFETI